MRKILIALPVLLGHAASTAAPPPVAMAPSGPWNVDFANSMCVLSRPYASGATNLVFKPAMVGDTLEMAVMTTTPRAKALTTGKAVVTVAGKAIGDATFTAYNAVGMRIVRIQFGQQKLPLAGVQGALSINADNEGKWLLNVTSIARALPTLNECQLQLRGLFKINEADLAPIVTYPMGNPVALFSTEDYPREALKAKQSGTVGVLLWVEADGRVSTCTTVETDAPALLQETTCNIIKRRARFTPAKDAANTPIRAPLFTRIRWTLPR